MGFMFRILDLEEYFRQQSHCDKPVSRAFTLELQVEDDFMESNNKTIRLRVDGDRVCQTDAQKADVILKAKIADLSSLVVGAIPLETFLWSEQMECSDHAYVQDIQNAIGWSRKCLSNMGFNVKSSKHMASLTATAPIEVALPSTTASATTLHPTSATRTRFQLTPDRVRGCDSCPACTATRCR